MRSKMRSLQRSSCVHLLRLLRHTVASDSSFIYSTASFTILQHTISDEANYYNKIIHTTGSNTKYLFSVSWRQKINAFGPSPLPLFLTLRLNSLQIADTLPIKNYTTYTSNKLAYPRWILFLETFPRPMFPRTFSICSCSKIPVARWILLCHLSPLETSLVSDFHPSEAVVTNRLLPSPSSQRQRRPQHLSYPPPNLDAVCPQRRQTVCLFLFESLWWTWIATVNSN